jgi:hypothetical protein
MVSHTRTVLGDNLPAVAQDGVAAQCYTPDFICSLLPLQPLKMLLSAAVTATCI